MEIIIINNTIMIITILLTKCREGDSVLSLFVIIAEIITNCFSNNFFVVSGEVATIEFAISCPTCCVLASWAALAAFSAFVARLDDAGLLLATLAV